MIVCAHGNVDLFCGTRGMIPVCRYDGDIEDYSGVVRILVTDREMSEREYYLLKSAMLAKGIELVSTLYEDSEFISKFIVESLEAKHRKKSGGRCKFGFQNIDGELKLTESGRAVVNRIFEMRDRGCTYNVIRNDDNVRHPDGRMLAVSTIQIILENRKVYEGWGR